VALSAYGTFAVESIELRNHAPLGPPTMIHK
jgi:hypothetical protein